MSEITIYNVVTYDTEMNKLHALAKERKWSLKSIVHDRDKGKKPHVHAILVTDADFSFADLRQIIKEAGVEGNVFVQACRDLERSNRYLTHDGWVNKVQYNPETIQTTYPQVLEDEIVRQSFITRDQDMLDDLLSPNFSHCAMARKYGRDYMVNIKSYMHFRELAKAEMSLRDAEELAYQQAQEAKRKAEELEAQAIRKNYDACVSYCLDHWNEAPTPDEVGTFTPSEYIATFEWIRAFKRDRQRVKWIPVWMLAHLPTKAREEVSGLIHKRMNDGFRYHWEDAKPDVMAELWDAQCGKAHPVLYCKRYDIFSPSSEYDYE